MPIINVIPMDNLLLEGTWNSYIEHADPKLWHWHHPVALSTVGELYFSADYNFDNFDEEVTYGLFFDKKLTNPVSAMKTTIRNGADFGLSSEKIAIIEMVATQEEHRNKGFGTLLYDLVLNRHKAIISDKDLYTDEGKISKSLGIWVNHLTKIGNVFNLNIETKKISYFSLKEASQSKNIRFMVSV